MIKKLFTSQRIKIFAIFAAIIFAAYIGLLNPTYNCYNYGGRMNNIDQMSFGEFFNSIEVVNNGRHATIIYWLIHAPLSKLGFTYYQNQWLFFAIDIIVLAIAAALIYEIFAKQLKIKKPSIPLILAIGLVVVHPFMVESLAFMIPSHPQALIFTALALLYITKKEKGAKTFLLAALFATLAISTYQSYYSLLLILALPLVFIQNEGKINKKLWLSILRVFAITAIGIAIVLIASKIHSAALGISTAKDVAFSLSPHFLLSRTKTLLTTYFSEMWRPYGIYPTGLIYGLLSIFMIGIATILIQKKKIKELIFIVLAMVFLFFSPVYYGIIASTFYLAPRITTATFAVLGIGAILIIYYLPQSIKKQQHIIEKSMLALLIAVTIFNVYKCSTLVTDIQISNRMEMANLRLIGERIKDYEQKTGKTITYIKFRPGDADAITTHDTYNTNNGKLERSSHFLTSTEWSTLAALNKVAGTNYQGEVMTNEEFQKYFSDIELIDYSFFDPDKRLEFVDDCMYWVAY